MMTREEMIDEAVRRVTHNSEQAMRWHLCCHRRGIAWPLGRLAKAVQAEFRRIAGEAVP